MGRLVLGLLVAIMLSLTGYIAYSTYGHADPVCPASGSCCAQEVSPCCPSAASESTPSCCQEKANCCQTKGEGGSCCQNPSKAEAIVGDKKAEKKDENVTKKD